MISCLAYLMKLLPKQKGVEHMAIIDVVIVLFYLLCMLLLGYVAKKRTKNMESFLIADRNLGFSMYMPCMCALILGGSSTLSSTRLGYEFGISGIWFVFLLALGVGLLGLLFSRRLIKSKLITVGQVLGMRFGRTSQLLCSIFMAVFLMMLSVVQIIAVGTLLHSLLGWNIVLSMLLGGVVGIAYSYMGGMWAVSFTDVFQWVILMIGIVCVFTPISLHAVGGFSALTGNLEPSYFSLGTIGGARIFSFFVLYTLGIFVDQSMWQRLSTAKSLKVAKYGSLGAMGFAWVYGLGVVIIGMCAAVLIPGLEDPQQAFGKMVTTFLPAGVSGLVIAGCLSAIMSTMSGPFLSSGTVIVYDLIIPAKKEISEEQKMRYMRISLLVIGVLTILIALMLQDILVALDFCYGVLVGGMLVPTIAALFWNRCTTKGAIASMLSGIIVFIGGIAVLGISSNLPIVYGVIAALIVIVIVSLATKPEENKLSDWEEKVRAEETTL